MHRKRIVAKTLSLAALLSGGVMLGDVGCASGPQVRDMVRTEVATIFADFITNGLANAIDQGSTDEQDGNQ